jgi:hypothetical protein
MESVVDAIPMWDLKKHHRWRIVVVEGSIPPLLLAHRRAREGVLRVTSNKTRAGWWVRLGLVSCDL